MSGFADNHLKAVPANGAAAFDPDTGEPLTAPLDRLRAALTDLDGPGDRITKVLKRGRQGASYALVLDDGQMVELGDTKTMLKPREVQAALLDATDTAMRVPKLEDWRLVGQLIARAAEVQDVTMTADDETRDWITTFIEGGTYGDVDLDDKEQIASALGDGNRHRGLGSFRGSDGRLHLHRSAFVHYVRRILGERVTAPEIGTRLGKLGFERNQLSVRLDRDRVAKQRMFVSEPGFDPEA